MKKTSFVILNIFIFCFLFGLAGNSSADYFGGATPEVVSPGIDEEDVPFDSFLTLRWNSPWVAEGEPEYVPDEETEVQYEWEIGTTIGILDNGFVVHPTTSVILSRHLASGTTYNWRVRANIYKITSVYPKELELDVQSEWGNGRFTTLGLTAPTITWPPDGSHILENMFDHSFEWDPVRGTELYFWELWNGKKEAKSTTKTSISPGSDFKSLEYDTNYTFNVKACISCEGVECDLCSAPSTHSFSTGPPEDLAKAQLSSPKDGATVSPTPTLIWKEVVGARYYKWQIREKVSGLVPRIDGDLMEGWVAIPETQIIIPKALPEIGGGYKWTINTCPEEAESNDCSGLSAEWTFLVDADLGGSTPPPPGTPINPSPTDGATGVSLTPQLAWKPVSGAPAYSPLIITNGWSGIVAYPHNSIYIPEGVLTGNTTYTWKVRVCKDASCNSFGAESAVWAFTTAGSSAPPPSETLTNSSPANGATRVSLTPQLCWKPVSGVAGYSPWIRNEWSDVVDSTEHCMRVPEGELTGNTTYTWKVRTCLARPCQPPFGAESAEWTFTTADSGGGTPGNGNSSGGGIQNPIRWKNFGELISAINKFIFTIAIILSPLLFIFAGIMLVTSTGDPAKVKKAQTMMIYTAVGLGVVILAQALIAVLKNVLGVNESTTYIPLLFSSLSLELKKAKVDKVFSQIKNIL